MRSLRKTCDRTSRFFGEALAWRSPGGRPYAVVAWGLIAGAVWFAIGLAGGPGWALPAIVATMFSPSPRPRSVGGNASVMIALEFAISIAPPMPWQIRIATSHRAAA